jgi:hypothetical protein
MTPAASPPPAPAGSAPGLTADQLRRLARLRPTDWVLLLLRRQGWPLDQLAAALGVSRGRIGQRLQRAHRALAVSSSPCRLLAAVPWPQCPAAARAAADRLLAHWRQEPPPATVPRRRRPPSTPLARGAAPEPPLAQAPAPSSPKGGSHPSDAAS